MSTWAYALFSRATIFGPMLLGVMVHLKEGTKEGILCCDTCIVVVYMDLLRKTWGWDFFQLLEEKVRRFIIVGGGKIASAR